MVASPIPSATSTPAPTLPGWQLIWDDEFDGNAINTENWTVASSLPGGYLGCCLAYGYASWSPNNVSVSDGMLHLLSTNEPLAGRPYTSGAVSTGQTFSFTYGRIDIRARLPRTDGLWPAFWLIPVAGDAPSYAPYETDLMEAWGGDTHHVYAYFHWQRSQVQCEASGPDYAAGFHVYTLIWSPGEFIWEVDGVTHCTSHVYVPDVAMYLNLSTAVGGRVQPTDTSTQLPQTTDIDSVRIWKPA